MARLSWAKAWRGAAPGALKMCFAFLKSLSFVLERTDTCDIRQTVNKCTKTKLGASLMHICMKPQGSRHRSAWTHLKAGLYFPLKKGVFIKNHGKRG